MPICCKSKLKIYRISSPAEDVQIDQTSVWKSAQWPQPPSRQTSSSQECVLSGKAGGQLFCLKSSVPLLTSLQRVCHCHWREPVLVQCSAAWGYSLGPLSCCEACACTVKSHFSCGFTPHELFSNFVGGTVQQDVFMG